MIKKILSWEIDIFREIKQQIQREERERQRKKMKRRSERGRQERWERKRKIDTDRKIKREKMMILLNQIVTREGKVREGKIKTKIDGWRERERKKYKERKIER